MMNTRALFAALLFTTQAFAQTGEILPNENLVLDGIPKLPGSIAEGVGRYTEFRAAGFVAWHPSKREMLITTRFADTGQLHWVKVPGGDRRQLTFFKEKVTSGAFPRHAGDFFVFAMDKGGNEFAQLYRYDVGTGDITLLSDGGARSQNGVGVFSHAGERMAYGSTRRNEKDRDLYVIDPRDPKSDRRVIEVEGGGWGVADWSPDDKRLLVVEGLSVSETYLWIADAATGEKKLLTPKGGAEKVAYEGPEWASDGKVYVTTDKDSEYQRLATIDPATGQHTFLTTGLKWDVEGFDVAPNAKTVAFVTNEDGLSVLHLLDTATGKEMPAPKFPVGVIGGVAFHENSKDLAVTLSTAQSPFDMYSVDVASGKIERWTESETGGLVTSGFKAPELVRWKSFDGRQISGFLYAPPAKFTGKRPVVINIHGGPEGQERPDFLGRGNYHLNELGVAWIFPNVRGSTGYGKSFVGLDNGVLREDSVKDIGALLDWIATRPDLDATRVMVTGGSYGGYMTLAVATNYNDRIRCSVDVVGISNFITFLERTEAYRRDLRRVEYGDERDPKLREFFQKISPLSNAAKITKPLFVIQGKNDPRVPYTESEQMVATVKKNASPVWYLMANDEGHGFGKKKNADFQFYATIAFMQEFLLK